MSWLENHDADCAVLLSQFEDPDARHDHFVQLLHGLDAVFTKKLMSFLEGDVRMDDGQEHPFLKSVADQIGTHHLPTPSQRSAFKSIYDKLFRCKAMGLPLREETAEEKDYRKAMSRDLIAKALKWRDQFQGTRTKTVIDSMAAQYKERGMLTNNQIQYLKTVVLAQVPEDKEA